ncbi:MAG: histidine phosphatase family protein [Alphaproteobacteria bacterium]|nr:histidine phosphatase family protein [Alphaproteobacteria bacterium]MCD8526129.1 histidine phosphatase family protein [Alphaproteobacteria bacterium]MCD8569935.1 histidine phosphatase family protein [Alphaproteobacteria bacterium]
MTGAYNHFHLPQAEIYAVRHAQSLGQVDRSAYLSPGDQLIPLTDLGHEQADETGLILSQKFAAAAAEEGRPIVILHSTCKRATQTAEGILKSFAGAQIAADERLDKQKFGLFNGLFSTDERRAADPEAYARYELDLKNLGPFYTRPPQGESISDVFDRTASLLQEIKDKPAIYILVTHGLPYLCAQAYTDGHDENWILEREDTIKNCQITNLTPQNESLTIKDFA